MYFFDKIEHKGTEIPANVGYLTTRESMDQYGAQVVTDIRVQVEDRGTIDAREIFSWRGESYAVQGDTMLHTKRGEPHHWTFMGRRVVG